MASTLPTTRMILDTCSRDFRPLKAHEDFELYGQGELIEGGRSPKY